MTLAAPSPVSVLAAGETSVTPTPSWPASAMNVIVQQPAGDYQPGQFG